MGNEIDLREIVGRYNAAWNAHDVASILAMHTEDSVFENHTSGGKAVGKSAIGKIIGGVFATLPDITFQSRRLYVGNDFVVQEWTATATFTQAITLNGSTFAPTLAPIAWDGVDVIPFVGDLVARKDVYADSLSFQRQIGA